MAQGKLKKRLIPQSVAKVDAEKKQVDRFASIDLLFFVVGR